MQGTLRITDANATPQSLVETVTGTGALIPNVILTDATGGLATTDGLGNLATEAGGVNSSLNLSTAVVIKAGPGRVRRVIVNAPGGTSGAFTLNDCSTTGAVSSANLVWTLPYNAADNLAGKIFPLDWPFKVGVVLSAVPVGGICAISWD